jgi:hypothetical protein
MCKDGKAAWDHWNRIFDGRRTSLRDGQPYTVRYEAVNAMLLNEFCKARRQIDVQQRQIEALTAGLQRVSAHLEVSKPAPRTVLNNQ